MPHMDIYIGKAQCFQRASLYYRDSAAADLTCDLWIDSLQTTLTSLPSTFFAHLIRAYMKKPNPIQNILRL